MSFSSLCIFSVFLFFFFLSFLSFKKIQLGLSTGLMAISEKGYYVHVAVRPPLNCNPNVTKFCLQFPRQKNNKFNRIF